MDGYDVQKEIDYWHERASSYEQTIVKLSNALAKSRPNFKGEWIVDSPNICKCSNCNFAIKSEVGTISNITQHDFHYCPHCGARMVAE